MTENQTSAALPDDKRPEIHPEDLRRIQQIARDLLMEPFTGNKSLETIQRTRTEMEKGIHRIRSAGSRIGEWISQSRFSAYTQNRAKRFVEELKQKKDSDHWSSHFEKINHIARKIRDYAVTEVNGLEAKTRQLTLALIEKGIDLLLQEDTPDWIIDQARAILNRPDINNMEQIERLTSGERQQLIDEIYPYSSRTFRKYLNRFGTVINIAMGAVVATNLPGTGIAVSIANMGKTLVKIGNRLIIMSAIYGRQISSKTALFKTSATIIGSLEDWESNKQHVPLDPDIIGELYIRRKSDTDNAAFRSLLNSVIRKDAYIAIPGVGMISLGKINLDDIKMDMLIAHLVQNFHERNRLISVYGKTQLQQALDDFSAIYHSLLLFDCIEKLKAMNRSSILKGVSKDWRTKLRSITGADEMLGGIPQVLDGLAEQIYHEIKGVNEPERSERITAAVRSAFDIQEG